MGWVTNFFMGQGLCLRCSSKGYVPRIYQVSVHKSLIVEDMGAWVNSVLEWDMRWHHTLFILEQILVMKLLVMLDEMMLFVGENFWSCKHFPKMDYSIRSVYYSLSEDVSPVGVTVSQLSHLHAGVQKSWTPSKVQVFY